MQNSIVRPVSSDDAGFDGSGRRPTGVCLRLYRLPLLMLLATLLVGCGVPVPADKLSYVGEWTGEGMSLLITRDGSVVYHRLRKGARTSMDAPLKGFHGDDFEVGVGPMSTVFKVEVPPHEAEGRWRMTVDGVELTRTR